MIEEKKSGKKSAWKPRVPDFNELEEEKVDLNLPLNMSEMKTVSWVLGKHPPIVEHIQTDIAENSINEEWKQHLKA